MSNTNNKNDSKENNIENNTSKKIVDEDIIHKKDKIESQIMSDVEERKNIELQKNSKRMKKLTGNLPIRLDYFTIINSILTETNLNRNNNTIGILLVITGIAFIFTIFNISDIFKLIIYIFGIFMIIGYIKSENNKREIGELIEVDNKSEWHDFLIKEGVADSLLDYVNQSDNNINEIIIFLLTTAGPMLFNFATERYNNNYTSILADIVIIISFLYFGIMKISNNEHNILLKKLFEEYKLKSILKQEDENDN